MFISQKYFKTEKEYLQLLTNHLICYFPFGEVVSPAKSLDFKIKIGIRMYFDGDGFEDYYIYKKTFGKLLGFDDDFGEYKKLTTSHISTDIIYSLCKINDGFAQDLADFRHKEEYS